MTTLEKLSTRLIERRNIVHDTLVRFADRYEAHELYAYTQTFKSSAFDNAPIEKQLHCKMCDIYCPLNTCAMFVLLPEVHESGKKYGSIHFHGLLRIHKKYKWFNKVLPFLKTLGFVTIKPCFELSKWIDYLIKDHSLFIKTPLYEYLITDEYNELYPKAKCKKYSRNNILPIPI